MSSEDELSIACDLCGKGLLIDSPVRYEVDIQIKAAYDPAEITKDDLKGDLQKKIKKLIRELEKKDEEEAMDEVYRTFQFDLCTSCQKKFVKDPLGRNSREFMN